MKCNNNLPLVFILFGLILFPCIVQSLNKQNYSKEIVEFTTSNGLKLKGILYLPREEIKSVVIYLTHPTFGVIDTTMTDTMYYAFALMQKLVEKNSGWLVFTTRSPEIYSLRSSKKLLELIPIFWNTTMFTYADDAEAAINYLKSREELKKAKIGLMGGSNAGCTAAIVASRNKDVGFVIITSSLFTNGIEWHKYGFVHSEVTPVYDELLRRGFSSMLKDSFEYNNKKFINNDSTFNLCYFNSIDTVNRQIVKYDNYDTIAKKAGEIMKSLWKNNVFCSNKENFYGHPLSYEMYIDSIIAKIIYKPINIKMIKWDPEKYYPKVNIPALIVFGNKDTIIEVRPNIEDAEKLAKKYKKDNFKIVVFDNCGHSLEEIDAEWKKENRKPKIKMSPLAIDLIPGWVEKLK